MGLQKVSGRSIVGCSLKLSRSWCSPGRLSENYSMRLRNPVFRHRTTAVLCLKRGINGQKPGFLTVSDRLLVMCVMAV